jgi:hypothetical protein
MDIAPWIGVKMSQRRRVSIAVGASIIAVAVYVDSIQQSGDFAFWLFLFGLITFNSGIHCNELAVVANLFKFRVKFGNLSIGEERLHDAVCVRVATYDESVFGERHVHCVWLHSHCYLFCGHYSQSHSSQSHLVIHSFLCSELKLSNRMYVKWVITFILYTLSFKAKNDAMFWLAVLGIIHCNSSFVKSLVNSFEVNTVCTLYTYCISLV